jgi:hypothetical protein
MPQEKANPTKDIILWIIAAALVVVAIVWYMK